MIALLTNRINGWPRRNRTYSPRLFPPVIRVWQAVDPEHQWRTEPLVLYIKVKKIEQKNLAVKGARSIPIVLLSIVDGAATSTLWPHPHVSHTLVPIQLSGLIDGSEDILMLIASFAVLSRHDLALILDSFWILIHSG
ncbi:hypothetical protein T02_15766 [Trichinella nativa]|uniref:Uncharacterized protein n=1 Tax=Trichinella nativa TaxID=6335 RepID=A0A0V1KSF8_9BILA|nr:hypothetical protein T02_15766 [Trichinella nativa]